MTNAEKYIEIFIDVFETTEEVAKNMIYKDEKWDSVGHMMLITEIENVFKIELETEDIVAFGSYSQGIDILKKYGIDM